MARYRRGHRILAQINGNTVEGIITHVEFDHDQDENFTDEYSFRAMNNPSPNNNPENQWNISNGDIVGMVTNVLVPDEVLRDLEAIDEAAHLAHIANQTGTVRHTGTRGTFDYDDFARFATTQFVTLNMQPEPTLTDERVPFDYPADDSLPLRTEHYDPAILPRDGNLYIYVTPAGRTPALRLIPRIVDNKWRYVDEQTGMHYVNSIQHSNINNQNFFDRIMDTHGISWLSLGDFRRLPPAPTSFNDRYGAKKSRKKLFRKVPIPEIKEEKHYANRKFIA